MSCSDKIPPPITCDKLPIAEKGFWYPDAKEASAKNLKEGWKAKRQKRGLCILCAGHGMLKDGKTGKIRECKCCDGVGRMKAKKL